MCQNSAVAKKDKFRQMIQLVRKYCAQLLSHNDVTVSVNNENAGIAEIQEMFIAKVFAA